jgi:hypothetical protein
MCHHAWPLYVLNVTLYHNHCSILLYGRWHLFSLLCRTPAIVQINHPYLTCLCLLGDSLTSHYLLIQTHHNECPEAETVPGTEKVLRKQLLNDYL